MLTNLHFNYRKDGYLFDKEAILQYIITKKNEYSRKMKEYEKQKKLEAAEEAEVSAVEEQKMLAKFISTEKNITTNDKLNDGAGTSGNSISNMAQGREKKLPCFWVPSQLPSAKITKLTKPESTIYCPVSSKPLKAKDLINIKFTLVNDPDDKKSLIVKDNRYMCPVTRDILSNSIPCAVIKTTGDVVTMECVEKIIKKDWIHPLTGDKLTEKDIIVMERVSKIFNFH